MCMGFAVIVDKDLNLYFCEPESISSDCSHSTILYRLGWKENTDKFNRKFIRIEYPQWTEYSFKFDEIYSLPAWAEENKHEIKNKADKLLNKVKPFLDIFKKEREAIALEYSNSINKTTKIYLSGERKLKSEYRNDMKELENISDKMQTSIKLNRIVTKFRNSRNKNTDVYQNSKSVQYKKYIVQIKEHKQIFVDNVSSFSGYVAKKEKYNG